MLLVVGIVLVNPTILNTGTEGSDFTTAPGGSRHEILVFLTLRPLGASSSATVEPCLLRAWFKPGAAVPFFLGGLGSGANQSTKNGSVIMASLVLGGRSSFSRILHPMNLTRSTAERSFLQLGPTNPANRPGRTSDRILWISVVHMIDRASVESKIRCPQTTYF